MIAKPFVKWVGGKSQLITEIDSHLPYYLVGGEECVYVEPFVGGEAVLFHLLSKYKNIKSAVINDINPRLIATYRVIKEEPMLLIDELRRLKEEYLPKKHEERTEMFMFKRKRFNEERLSDVETASLFIFLNRTCFNGLYRENAKGGFNVPHGRYEQSAQRILDVRAKYPGKSLAELYNKEKMPDDLRETHRMNDELVMKAYGFDLSLSESEVVARLMEMYEEIRGKR